MSEPPQYPPPGPSPDGGGPPPPGPSYPGPSYPGPSYPGPSYPGQSHPGQPLPGPAGPWSGVPGAPIAAHKPGAVPLRPLGLGDVYDAAFRVLRYNPRATIGGAALVAVVSALLPVAVALVAVLAAGVTLDLAGDGSAGSGGSGGDATGFVVLLVSLASGAGLLSVGLVLVTGMVAGVTHAAAVGRRVGLEEAWAGTRGRRWRLIGLSVLTGLGELLVLALAVVVVVVVAVLAGTLAAVLVGLLVAALAVVALVFLYTRLVPLAAPALVIERLGVAGALRRAWGLSRSGFWRLLGISLLTALLVAVVGGILGTPFNLVGQVAAVTSERYGLLVLVVAQSVGSVLRSAFTTPFTAAVNTLLYLDRRIRTEAYEIELMQQAGLLGP